MFTIPIRCGFKFKFKFGSSNIIDVTCKLLQCGLGVRVRLFDSYPFAAR